MFLLQRAKAKDTGIAILSESQNKDKRKTIISLVSGKWLS